MPNSSPLILVPKAIVRRSLHSDPAEYYRHYVLEYFKEDELANQSPLTYTIKSGALRVRKGDVEKKYRNKYGNGTPGVEKRVNLDGTLRGPNLLARFKSDKRSNPPMLISHEGMAESVGVPGVDYDELLRQVLVTPRGKADAVDYERNVEALLTVLFHPALVFPRRQERIHAGRKILDISYTNSAREDFFQWLAFNYSAATVVVECKNYTKELGNPEYEQLTGRFSPSRGKYGLLVFRSCDDKGKLLESCRDASRDDRGFITPLDDEDLKILVDEVKAGSCVAFDGLLDKRFMS
jgi:hypothetical protein